MKTQKSDHTDSASLTGSEKLFFDVIAGALMITIFLVVGLVYFLFLNPVLGEEKAAAIFVFVVMLPAFLIGHLLANLIIKKYFLPRYLSRRAKA